MDRKQEFLAFEGFLEILGFELSVGPTFLA